MWNDKTDRAVLIDGGSIIRSEIGCSKLIDYCSPGYLPLEAEEQEEGSTTRATLFSYGAVLYEVVTSGSLIDFTVTKKAELRKPHYQDRLIEDRPLRLYPHWKENILLCTQTWQKEPPQREQYNLFLAKLIDIDPNQRFASAAEALREDYVANIREYAAETVGAEESKDASA